jgi:hypothetical protein
MLANIKPGKPARLAGAITTPYIEVLIEAKRHSDETSFGLLARSMLRERSS